MKNDDIMEKNGRKKFSILLSNPPYDHGLHEKFLLKYFDISDKIITIQPVQWLLGQHQKRKITEKINQYFTEIETVNGNEYFDAGLFADVSINYVDNKKPHKLIFNNKEYNKCEEITQFSTDTLLEEFNNKIGNVKNSIWDHIKGTVPYYKGYEEHPNENWWIVRLSEIRGHVATNGNKESSDFYTIISKDNEFMKNNIGKYKNIKKIPTRKGKYEFGYFAFETEQELNNFIRYIKTDFVRGCLKLSKNHSNQFRGCFKTIPWFDFSDDHFSKSPKEIDNWLFKKYNISDEIRKHIEEILPDYYGIRK